MSDAPAPSPIAWSWPRLLLGVVYAVPAAAVALTDPAQGLAFSLGLLPAAALGLRGPRRARVVVVVVGAVAGLALLLGSLVAATPVLAVVTILVLAVLAAAATSDAAHRLAPLVLALGVPLVGAGLSMSSPGAGVGVAVLMVAGSVYAWLVALLWPPGPAPSRPARVAPPRAAVVAYGVQLGLAGAVGAACGFTLGLDHPGWAATAAMLVSRPRWLDLRARGVGRSCAVLAGALLACGVAALSPPDAVLAALLVAAVAGATATSGSRWYVLPFFSTTLVLSLLLVGDDATAAHWFLERVGETLLGVALALGAAAVVPRAARRLAPSGTS